MAQPARGRAQCHFRPTCPAGGQGQSLSAWRWIPTGPKGGRLQVIWAREKEAELIFNMGSEQRGSVRCTVPYFHRWTAGLV